MRIKVLHVDVNEQGSGAKKYKVAEVLYDQAGNKKSFKVMSFVNPQVFKTISEAKNGDEFDVAVTKNDAGYNQWNSIEPASAGSAPATTSSGPQATTKATGGGNWETKEEREARQRYIIRQSSLSNAIAVLTAGAKAPPKPDEVIKLADDFVAYVFGVKDIFDEGTPNDIDNE